MERYCTVDTINYVLSDFAERCKAENTAFIPQIELEKMDADEIMFSTILSNALDNALNAQKSLPVGNREIRVMLKNADNRILLSVKNPIDKQVVFVDGMPLSNRKGHGYGTQSIRYMTERLGGNCQFTVQDQYFIARVII